MLSTRLDEMSTERSNLCEQHRREIETLKTAHADERALGMYTLTE